MGFRGSRVQIPPSRLSEDQALQRLSPWGFFCDCTPCCELCCELRGSSRGSATPAKAGPARPSQIFTGGEVLADGVPDVLQRLFLRRSLRPTARLVPELRRSSLHLPSVTRSCTSSEHL